MQAALKEPTNTISMKQKLKANQWMTHETLHMAEEKGIDEITNYRTRNQNKVQIFKKHFIINPKEQKICKSNTITSTYSKRYKN